VSTRYLTSQSSTLEKKAWLDFFVTLGLHEFVPLQSESKEMHSSDLVSNKNIKILIIVKYYPRICV